AHTWRSQGAGRAVPAIGLKDWVENVRTLAPGARIPFVVQIMAEAYEAGLTPQQFADTLPKLSPYTNWVACQTLRLPS
ncbi:MAG: hypothetical protein WCD60_11070, partial [Pseudolabrys sp.]